MDFRTAISNASFFFAKCVGIWFAAWAIRYKAKWDYRLSAKAKAVRWGVVGVGCLLAPSLPGPGYVRVVVALAALCFLCWPNFAYHLTNLFVEWPTTLGRVVSVAPIGSGWLISYAFEVRDDTFGGTARLKAASNGSGYVQGQSITVHYDPLNPDESKIARPSPAEA